MAYSKFSLKTVKNKFLLQLIEDEHLFLTDTINKVTISDYLKTTLKEFAPLALFINTEKSRSEWIIAPILAELRRILENKISLFSGSTFTVEEEQELYHQGYFVRELVLAVAILPAHPPYNQ